jgi:hypothetical protein
MVEAVYDSRSAFKAYFTTRRRSPYQPLAPLATNAETVCSDPGSTQSIFHSARTLLFVKELAVQLRADAANILNHPAFGTPSCGGANCNPSISFDSTGKPTTIPTITTTTIGPRSFQLNARVSF